MHGSMHDARQNTLCMEACIVFESMDYASQHERDMESWKMYWSIHDAWRICDARKHALCTKVWLMYGSMKDAWEHEWYIESRKLLRTIDDAWIIYERWMSAQKIHGRMQDVRNHKMQGSIHDSWKHAWRKKACIVYGSMNYACQHERDMDPWMLY